MKHTLLTGTVVAAFTAVYIYAAQQPPNITINTRHIQVVNRDSFQFLTSQYPMMARIPGQPGIPLGYFVSIECSPQSCGNIWSFTRTHCSEALVKDDKGNVLLCFRQMRPLIIDVSETDTTAQASFSIIAE